MTSSEYERECFIAVKGHSLTAGGFLACWSRGESKGNRLSMIKLVSVELGTCLSRTRNK
jgi:hypothetical protein